MPRYDLQQTRPFDSAFVEAIVSAIKAFDLKASLNAAFARYPGPGDPGDFFSPDVPSAKNLRKCLVDINDQERMLRPFLSRLIEDQWGNLEFKQALLEKMPDLVMAPVGLQAALAGVSAGVRQLLDLIADDPKFGAVGKQPGDENAFAMVCKRRNAFVQLRDSLGHLQALKELHDALHILAIGGADWLDPTLDDEDDDANAVALPPAALAARVAEARAIVVAKKTGLKGLKKEHEDLGEKAAAALGTAITELTAADADAQAAGVEHLRQTLMSLPKDIDDAMFGLSRDLPVRAVSHGFGKIYDLNQADYAKFDQAQRATAQLGEALRGRVLEHAMWQATDLSIHALDYVLCAHDPGFLKPFVERWQDIRRFIRYLSDADFQRNPPDLLVVMALDAYDRGLRTPVGSRAELSLADAFVEIVKTFSAFKAFPRDRFLAVDKALKEELGLIGALKKDLDELVEKRVGPYSANMVTDPILLDKF